MRSHPKLLSPEPGAHGSHAGIGAFLRRSLLGAQTSQTTISKNCNTKNIISLKIMEGGESSKGDSDLWKPKEAALHTHPSVCFQRSYIPTSRTFIQISTSPYGRLPALGSGREKGSTCQHHPATSVRVLLVGCDSTDKATASPSGPRTARATWDGPSAGECHKPLLSRS